MGYICKLVVDGREQAFEYDSEVLNEIFYNFYGQKLKLDLNKKVISVMRYSVCNDCGKLLLESIEVSTINDNTDKHICEYCSKHMNLY